MVKILLIVLVLLFVLCAVAVLCTLGGVLPWFVVRNAQSISKVDASSKGDPAYSASCTAQVTEQLSPVPICFEPVKILTFAFTPEAARLMVRASLGVQIYDLEAGVQDACIRSIRSPVPRLPNH